MSASPSATLPRAQRACSLRIGGLQAMTTLDYPDHLACVLFCQGCAWRCRYCHNPELIAPRSDSELDWQQVRQFLRRRQGLLQAVVFSGGEATLQPGLAAAMGEVRELGFKVGLHSAGIKPAALAEVLPLCDWVGFDVKAQAAHSEQITLVAGSGQANWQSLALLLRSGVAHECRTTVHWQLTSPAQLLALARAFPTVTLLQVDALVAQLRSILAQVTLAIEYVLLFVLAAGITVLLAGLQATLDERIRQGALLREGIKVVIAGQPNAGKSSLLNALAGAELAIVTPIAGTTRDKVQETIQINGVPLHVIDTAGLRESSDEVERIGIARAWEEIAQADAVLFLHDLTRSNAPEYQAADADIATVLAQKLPKSVPVLHIWNKEDIANTATAVPAAADGLRLSAKHGQGLDALRQRLLEIAGWQSAPEGLYIARARHVQALQATGEHLEQAHALLQTTDPALDLLAEELRLAQHHLGAITGEFTSDDLLGVIFSSFCIGK